MWQHNKNNINKLKCYGASRNKTRLDSIELNFKGINLRIETEEGKYGFEDIVKSSIRALKKLIKDN